VLEPFVEQDWAVPAGDLTWDIGKTVTHVIDAVGFCAAHLAVQSPARLRVDFLAHNDASNAELLDVLAAAAAMLAQVARAAPPGARAYHDAGMADSCGFVAMGCRPRAHPGCGPAVSAWPLPRRRNSPPGDARRIASVCDRGCGDDLAAVDEVLRGEFLQPRPRVAQEGGPSVR